MARCILHAGMHKTGSTSIQLTFNELDDDSFYYARILNAPNHSRHIQTAFSDNPGGTRLNRVLNRRGFKFEHW